MSINGIQDYGKLEQTVKFISCVCL